MRSCRSGSGGLSVDDATAGAAQTKRGHRRVQPACECKNMLAEAGFRGIMERNEGYCGKDRVMQKEKERDANLIFVAAVEEYGLRHQMQVKDVLSLFAEYNIFSMLRLQYEVLHTMDLGEGADFAESVLQGGKL